MKESSKSERDWLPRLLTTADAARFSQVSEKTIYREIDAGRLQAVKIGTRYRIHPDDYLRWLENCRVDRGVPVASPRRRLASAKTSDDGPGALARLRAIEAGS